MEMKESPANASAETRRQVLKMVEGSAATTLSLPIRIDAASQAVSHAAHIQARETPGVPYVLKYLPLFTASAPRSAITTSLGLASLQPLKAKN
jgi:hypothetical protein